MDLETIAVVCGILGVSGIGAATGARRWWRSRPAWTHRARSPRRLARFTAPDGDAVFFATHTQETNGLVIVDGRAGTYPLRGFAELRRTLPDPFTRYRFDGLVKDYGQQVEHIAAPAYLTTMLR